MVVDFKHLRPPANYPIYPPYHNGDYIEEYFYKFYLQNKIAFDKTGFTLIPVFWTNVYITNINRHLLQPYLDVLPPGKYFTVSQHDDAITESVPEGTLCFEAGGNRSGIPIPLICSPLTDEQIRPVLNKDIFCSFVGSINAPIRERLFHLFNRDSNFYFSVQMWSNQVQSDRLAHFIELTKRSHFSLCPRGYGAQSFRLYEVLQLGSIPVFIYDKDWFPFSDEINWSEFCVLIHETQIPDIKNILSNISIDQQNKMLEAGKNIYKKYFTLESTSKQILKILSSRQ